MKRNLRRFLCPLLVAFIARAQTGPVNYTPYSIVTYAGYANRGSFDGVGLAAQFGGPTGLAVDASGNVYVADTNNHTIRKITPGGSVTTIAGTPGISGYADGPSAAAQFSSPAAVAVDNVGNIFVADAGNGVIRAISTRGVVTTFAGTPTKPDSAGTFSGSTGIAVDATGNVFLTSALTNSVRKITPQGVVSTALNSASSGGTIPVGGKMTGVALDGAGNLYAMEASGLTTWIVKLTPTGTLTTLAAIKTSRRFPPFSEPFSCALAIDAKGVVYVADNVNEAALAITPDGTATTLASLTSPRGIAVDASGNVFLAESGLDTIARITPGGTPAAFAGATNLGGVQAKDGIGRAARFVSPVGIAVDAQGVIYVGDADGPSIRKIFPGGIVTTLAGFNGHVGGSQDGVGTDARFLSPHGVALDSAGNLFVADADNATIRKVTSDGAVTTWAGMTGVKGSADGPGASAQFSYPDGVVLDANNNVYVSDYSNNTIRKISPTAVVSTFAGAAGVAGSADGTSGDARFNGPAGLAIDSRGNLFVADLLNSTIRKITPAGVVSTVAGLAGANGIADGTSAVARFWYPSAVAVDGSGNLFVTETTNNTIRRIDANGTVTTLAGMPWPAPSMSIDGVGAAARFGAPGGIVVDANGNLFIADSFNQEIRIGSARPPQIAAAPGSALISYGVTTRLAVSASGSLNFQWALNGFPIAGATTSSYSTSFGGSYTVTASNAAGSVTSDPAIVTVANRVANLSSRVQVQSGANASIVGFVIAGVPGSTKQILLRAIGPALAQFGVGNFAAQPTLSLYDSNGSVVATNSDWSSAPVPGNSGLSFVVQAATSIAMTAVGAFPVQANSADCAMVATLPPGLYTAQVSNTASSTSVGLAELYEMRSTDSAVLANISTRANVGTGGNVAIAGFVVSGSQPAHVLIRAAGPALSAFGLSGLLAQPVVSVYDQQGKLIAANTGWSNSPTLGDSATNAVVQSASAAVMQGVGAFPFSSGSADSAMILLLPAGSYSAHVSGLNNTTGVALVEVYQIP